jgi:hypothetical protein
MKGKDNYEIKPFCIDHYTYKLKNGINVSI